MGCLYLSVLLPLQTTIRFHYRSLYLQRRETCCARVVCLLFVLAISCVYNMCNGCLLIVMLYVLNAIFHMVLRLFIHTFKDLFSLKHRGKRMIIFLDGYRERASERVLTRYEYMIYFRFRHKVPVSQFNLTNLHSHYNDHVGMFVVCVYC